MSLSTADTKSANLSQKMVRINRKQSKVKFFERESTLRTLDSGTEATEKTEEPSRTAFCG